jgi:tetratricopeptide (TPR) repeat protein
MAGDADRLRGWKEISDFLGANERTAKRWEANRGLPIYRPPGGDRGPVYASRQELSAWLRTTDPATLEAEPEAALPPPAAEPPIEPARKPRRRLWLRVGLPVAIVGVGLAIMAMWRPSQAPLPTSEAARKAWVDGEYALSTRNLEGIRLANARFAEVVRDDPGFIPAQARLAVSYNMLAQYDGLPGSVAYARAETVASRALTADPLSAASYAARGFARFYGRRDAIGAMADLQRAVSLDPDNAEAHQWLALVAMHGGDQRVALPNIEAAARLDPRSRAIQANRALILMHAGRWADAEKLLLELRRIEPSFRSPASHLASLYLAQSRWEDYVEIRLKSAVQRDDAQAIAQARQLESALRQGGGPAVLATLRDFAAKEQNRFRLAGALAMLGDKDRAFAMLDAALAAREPETMAMMVDLTLASLRSDPRFGARAVAAGFTPESLLALAGEKAR